MTVSPLSAADLAQMRAAALELMPSLCSITDPGGVVDTESGGTETVGPSTTDNVPCRLSRTGYQPAMLEFGAQLVADADYILTTPYGTVIQEGWKVRHNGTDYTVTSVGYPPTWGTAVRALIVAGRAIGG